MRLYAVTYHDADSPSGRVTIWHTTRRAAERAMSKLRREFRGVSSFFIYDQEPRAIHIPRDRAGMARFLTDYQP
jgi:hypothetical protein